MISSFSRSVLWKFRTIETKKFHKLAYTYGNCVLLLVNGVDKTTPPIISEAKKTTKIATQINLKRLSYDLQLKTSKAIQELESKRFFTTTAIRETKTTKNTENIENMENKSEKLNVNKDELKKRLTPLQYQVTQEAATERPFSGCYNKHYEKGVYQCIVCHQDLFSSDTKYDSGCGWPAFNDVLDKGKITLHRDASIPVVISKTLGMVRTEVRCSKCSAHMGHVFDDGPPPKFQRFCINSASIDFVPLKKATTAATGAAAATIPSSSNATTNSNSNNNCTSNGCSSSKKATNTGGSQKKK